MRLLMAKRKGMVGAQWADQPCNIPDFTIALAQPRYIPPYLNGRATLTLNRFPPFAETAR